LIAAVALSMALTPFAMLINERLVRPRLGTRETAKRPPDEIEGENSFIIAGYGRVGTVIGRLLQASGVVVTVLDLDSDHVEMLRTFGAKVFYGDASRVEMLRAAGADSAKVLVIAVDDPERILEIIELSHKHFPNLEILARATGRTHAFEVLDAGVDRVYRESFDSSIRIGVDVMRLLGVPAHEAHRRGLMFRAHDEEVLREQRAMRSDQDSFIRTVRLQTETLEELMRSDVKEESHIERDGAWDAESLRREFGGGETA
jgi:voltage-gated potassium channel Kch